MLRVRHDKCPGMLYATIVHHRSLHLPAALALGTPSILSFLQMTFTQLPIPFAVAVHRRSLLNWQRKTILQQVFSASYTTTDVRSLPPCSANPSAGQCISAHCAWSKCVCVCVFVRVNIYVSRKYRGFVKEINPSFVFSWFACFLRHPFKYTICVLLLTLVAYI